MPNRTTVPSVPYRLRLPGPTVVPEPVRQAISQPVVNHRGPEFRTMLARVQELVQPVLGTANSALFFASSGTGLMEAKLASIKPVPELAKKSAELAVPNTGCTSSCTRAN